MKKNPSPHHRWILITGLSGSGKTTALKIFEDQGFFSIDNLPAALLSSLMQLLKKSKKSFPKVALGMDAREHRFLTSYPEVLNTLKVSGFRPEILFFECREDILVRRFSESRRPHPLEKKAGLLKAILEEKTRMEPLRRMATKIFDTSETNVHNLKKALQHYLHPKKSGAPLTVNLLSFGYKFGIPVETDLFFDVRFLTNPFFVPRLKNLTGLSPSIQRFVLKQKDARIFLTQVFRLISFLLPLYQREGKAHLTIAFGCTGGKHRSVVISEILKKKLLAKNRRVSVVHRDMDKIVSI